MIIDCESMDSVKNQFDNVSISEEMKNNLSDYHQNNNNSEDDKKFKSKNLEAERRRRKKLSDRQLELRSLVPIITNMNKATIITDAISYIKELKKEVKNLGDQLQKMEATRVKEEKEDNFEDIESEKKWGIIHPEVEVIDINGTKLWIKILFQKKKGGLTKVMEALNLLGIDLTCTSVTTNSGAVLLTSFMEGSHGGVPDAAKIKEFLFETIRRN